MTSLLPNTRRPDVSFHCNGRIDITARIAKMLHLQRGDVIDVALTNGEYMLYVRLRQSQCTGRHEAAAMPTNKGKRENNNFRAYSSRLCKTMLNSVRSGSDNEKVLRFPAGHPMVFGPNGTGVPIITRNPL